MLAAIIILGLFILLEVLSYLYFYLFYQVPVLKHFLFIGVLVHESAHYIMCRLTGAPVFEFKVGLNQGHVKHGNSRIPFIGNMFISLAPLFVGTLLLVIIMLSLSSLSLGDFAKMAQAENIFSFEYLKTNFLVVLNSFNYASIKFWILLFLSLIILAAFKPSHQDFKNVIWPLILILYLSYYEFMAPINLYIIFTFLLANSLQVIAIILLLPFYFLKKVLVRH